MYKDVVDNTGLRRTGRQTDTRRQHIRCGKNALYSFNITQISDIPNSFQRQN